MYIPKSVNEIYLLLFSINYIIKGLIEENLFKFMKYILPLLLLSAILIPISYTVHAQNQSNKVFQNITGLDKGNNNNSTNQSANQSIANDQNKTGQTEQDKAVKNVTQSTNQVAKQASEALNKIGNQVGQAFQNITKLNNEKNISNK